MTAAIDVMRQRRRLVPVRQQVSSLSPSDKQAVSTNAIVMLRNSLFLPTALIRC
jgi:hypothetical protein